MPVIVYILVCLAIFAFVLFCVKVCINKDGHGSLTVEEALQMLLVSFVPAFNLWLLGVVIAEAYGGPLKRLLNKRVF